MVLIIVFDLYTRSLINYIVFLCAVLRRTRRLSIPWASFPNKRKSIMQDQKQVEARESMRARATKVMKTQMLRGRRMRGTLDRLFGNILRQNAGPSGLAKRDREQGVEDYYKVIAHLK